MTAERVGQGEVGGCNRRVQTACARLGSAIERSWLAPGKAISVVFSINGLRK